MTYRDLSPEEAHQEISENKELKILDVRTQPEFDAYRIEGAQLLPIQELQMRIDEIDPRFAYIVYCEHGMRSVAACEFLATQGFSGLTNVRGGMAAWIGSDLPFER